MFLATIRTDLDWQERILLGWVAPRGIVAAAVAATFSTRMFEAGYADASKLLPLVFALIVTTVVLHGFSIGWLARHLNLCIAALGWLDYRRGFALVHRPCR